MAKGVLFLSVFLYLILISLPITTQAQPQFYNSNDTVGINVFPLGTDAGNMTQWLIAPGEFSNPSSATSGEITKVSLFIGSAGSRIYTDLRILMSQTTDLQLPAGTFYSGAFDTVYFRSSGSLTGTYGQWMTITLDSVFLFDNTKSLVIQMEQCGSIGSGMGICYAVPSATRRKIWSVVNPCPYVYTGYNGTIINLGIDVAPLSPTNLSLEVLALGEVKLTWTDNSSNETGFTIERKDDINTAWTSVGSVGMNVTEFINNGLTTGRTYDYRVYANGSSGNSSYSNVVTTTITNITHAGVIPDRYALHSNYPNPFNPTTKIKYDVPTAGFVSLKVHDINGKVVATLINGHKAAGHHSIDFSGLNLASGIYICRMESGSFRDSKKMMLLK